MFEALPMLILQTINNSMRESHGSFFWEGFIEYSSLFSSGLSIYISAMTLMSILNDSTADVYFRFL